MYNPKWVSSRHPMRNASRTSRSVQAPENKSSPISTSTERGDSLRNIREFLKRSMTRWKATSEARVPRCTRTLASRDISSGSWKTIQLQSESECSLIREKHSSAVQSPLRSTFPRGNTGAGPEETRYNRSSIWKDSFRESTALLFVAWRRVWVPMTESSDPEAVSSSSSSLSGVRAFRGGVDFDFWDFRTRRLRAGVAAVFCRCFSVLPRLKHLRHTIFRRYCFNLNGVSN